MRRLKDLEPAEQRRLFALEIQKRIFRGELHPSLADAAMDYLLHRVRVIPAITLFSLLGGF